MKLVILPQSSTVQKVLDVIAGPAHVAKSQISPEMLTKFDQLLRTNPGFPQGT
jgi:hypothetical protein